MNSREAKALEIVRSGVLVSPIPVGAGKHVLVPSSETDGAFYVTSAENCTCADHRYRGVVCKHSLAVRLQAVLDEASAESLVTSAYHENSPESNGRGT